MQQSSTKVMFQSISDMSGAVHAVKTRHDPSPAARDVFERMPSSQRQAVADLHYLFESGHKRVAGGWLEYILLAVQILDLLGDTIKKLNVPGDSKPVDESAAPIRAFVEMARRITQQIQTSRDERCIDAWLAHLEGDAADVSNSKRARVALAEVHAAARTAKSSLTQSALQAARAQAAAMHETYNQEISALRAGYEELTTAQRQQQKTRFNQQLADVRENQAEAALRAQQYVKSCAEQAEQQKTLLELAQGTVCAAREAADQAAINANAAMPSATSRMLEVSRNSRPAPTSPPVSTDGLDPAEVVTFLTLVTRALPELQQAHDRVDVRRILRDNDRDDALALLSPRTRSAGLEVLCQQLKQGIDLSRLMGRLLGL